MDPPTNQNESKEESKAESVATREQQQREKKGCIACQRKRDGGKPYKHGHAPFCTKSIYYGMSTVEIAATKEKRSLKLKEKANVVRRSVAKDRDLIFPKSTSAEHLVGGIPIDFTPEFLRDLVAANQCSTPTKAPRGISVILQYFQAIAPVLKRGTNEPVRHEDNNKRLEIHERLFPKGSLTFTIPKLDPTQAPDPDYQICAGCSICIARWELQDPGQLKCTACKDERLVYKKSQISQYSVKPVVDMTGKLVWCFLPTYRCCKCETIVLANDPDLLRNLPHWMQSAYPSDYNWVNKGKLLQYGRGLSRLIETAMTSDSRVDCHFVAYHLHRQYQLTYRDDFDGLIESSELSGVDEPSTESWTLKKWLGEFDLPTGESIRNTYEAAMAGGDWKVGASNTKGEQPTHDVSSNSRTVESGPVASQFKSNRKRKKESITVYTPMAPAHGKHFPHAQVQQPMSPYHQRPHWAGPPSLGHPPAHPSRSSYGSHYPSFHSSYYQHYGGLSHDAHPPAVGFYGGSGPVALGRAKIKVSASHEQPIGDKGTGQDKKGVTKP